MSSGVQAAVPAPVPYVWKHATIIAGGFIPDIVFSPVQRGLAYVRTDIGGFYRSNDAGKHWAPITDWVSPEDGNWLGGESVAPDPVDPNTVYLAAGMYSKNPAAILRSHDQGRTFMATAVPIHMGGNELGRGVGERLSVDPNDTRVLYFGSRYDGLWKSTDSAVSWHRVDSFPQIPGGTVGDWAHPGYGIARILYDRHRGSAGRPSKTLYAGIAQPGTEAALYRSTDAGETWAAVPGLPAGLCVHQGALDGNGSLYLTLGNGPGPNDVTGGAVMKLNLATGEWTNISPDKPTAKHGFGYAGLCLDAQHLGTLIVTTTDRWYPGDDVFRTTNGGHSWKPVKPTQTIDVSLAPYLNWGEPKPREGWWMDAVALDPFDSNHAMYGTGATIYGTHDLQNVQSGTTTHWDVEAEGIEETAAICLISPTAGPHLVTGLGDIGGFTHDDLTVSPPGGMTKNPMNSNTDGLDFAAAMPSVFVRVGNKGGSISTDSGRSWTTFGTDPSRGRGGSIAITADAKSIIWASGRNGVSVSTDRGRSWKRATGLPAGAKVVADRVDPNVVYAFGDRTVFVSSDGGAHFSAAAGRLPAKGDLVASPAAAGELWLAGDSDGLLHSTDGGSHFTKIAGVKMARLVALGKPAAGRRRPAVYLAGTIAGKMSIYRSDDDGVAWVRLPDDAHQFGWLPDALAADPRVYGRVYLGTNGRGIPYGEPANSQ